MAEAKLMGEPIYEEEGAGFRMAVLLSQNKMEGYLVLEKTGDDFALSPEDLAEKLNGGGVTVGVDTGRLGLAMRGAMKGGKAEPVLVARGTEPKDGEDGQIEFYVQPSSEEARYERGSDGSVDYHSTHLIENVFEAQEVARVLPPRPGVQGRTVTGETLDASDGEPAKVRAGKGVRVESGGELFVAEIPGRLVVEDDTLSISQSYEIKGNADYSTGDVDFVGQVTVSGDVQDDFKVKAGMGLEVRGTIGACGIEVTGPLTVGGGIAGKTRAEVHVEGPVRAKYVNEAKLEAADDITIEREAYNSILHTTGKVVCEQGKIIGGEVIALRGIIVGTAGSEMGVATRLSAGIDYRRAERLRQTAENVERIEQEIAHISEKIGPLLANPAILANLPTDKKKVVKRLLTQVRALKERRERIGEAREAVSHEIEAAAVRQVNVLKEIFPSVTVEIGAARSVIRKAQTGPLSLLENVDGALYEAPLTELKAGRAPGELVPEIAPEEPPKAEPPPESDEETSKSGPEPGEEAPESGPEPSPE